MVGIEHTHAMLRSAYYLPSKLVLYFALVIYRYACALYMISR